MNHVVEFVAGKATGHEQDGVYIVGYQSDDESRYVVIQRRDDEAEVMIEFDDQKNSGYQIITDVEVHVDLVSIHLSELVDGVNHFNISRGCSRAEWDTMLHHLKFVSGDGEFLDVDYGDAP